MVSEWTFISIATELVVTAVTLIMGFSFLIRYIKMKKKLMPYVSGLGFLSALFYLGPIASFFTLLATGYNLDKNTVAFLSYSLMPLLIVDAMFLGFSIFNPDRTKLAVLIYACTAVPYWIALFWFPDVMIIDVTEPGELIDITMRSVLLVILVIYIFSSLLILGGGFWSLRKKIEGKDKRKATDLCLAFVIFAIAGILEATTPILALISRVLMLISYVFMYRGFSAA